MIFWVLFFALVSLGDEGSQVMGFGSEEECNAARADIVVQFKQLGKPVQVSDCIQVRLKTPEPDRKG